MMMIFSVAPAIAPVIGGWIHVLLGWRSVFGLMVVLGVAAGDRELSAAAGNASAGPARRAARR